MLPVRLSILIPVYNDAYSVAAVLQRIITAPMSYFESEHLEVDLIVVDDGSTDCSHGAVKAFSREHPEVSLQLITQPVNSGRGVAIRTAIEHADSDFCLIQDAGFEYDPADYPKLLAPLLSDEADVVLGSRFICSSQRRPLAFWQAAANRAISVFAGMVANLDLSDVQTGYKAFRTSLAQSVPLHSKRYNLDSEIVIQFAKRHARFVEVPITYRGRTQEEGSKVDMRGTLFALGSILRAWVFSGAHTDPAADMLIAMSRAKHFNRWVADTLAPSIEGEVLELGAGIGNLTVLLSTRARRYIAADTDEEHLFELRSRTANRPNVTLALCDLERAADIAALRQSVDTVICLNALERVDDDVTALRNMCQCLRPGGIAIILVPQGEPAFGKAGQAWRQKRHYSRDELEQKLCEAGFMVQQITGFNRAAWPGWDLNSRLPRRRTLSRLQLHLFDLLVPLWRRVDHRIPWSPTSLIAIGIADL